MSIKIILAVAVLFTISSCTKVIQIDLNSSNPQFVIEGNVSSKSNIQTVTISKTINFSDAGVYPAVSNAVVTLTDNNNAPVALALTAPGVYTTTSITAISGHQYELKVVVDGKTFVAKSTIPQPVLLDSIDFELQQSFGGNVDSLYFLTPKYTDPAPFKNYYLITQKVDTLLDRTIFAFNDNLNNGLVNRRPIFSNNSDIKLKSGSTVKVELMGIDKNIYDYYNGLSNVVPTSGGPATTPANPVSNFSGGALGYFSAHSYHTLTKVIP
jgi:hypothetical protein